MSKKFMVYGSSGWIGTLLKKLIIANGDKVIAPISRLENRNSINEELDIYDPDFIILAAGVTGRPNVDWCETHKEDTIRANIIGCLNLIDIAHQRNKNVTIFGTGCIYEYDAEHPMHSGIGFKETDKPNFDKSIYSWSKIIAENVLSHYRNVLTLRIRMPLSHELTERNFITKITNYEKVVNIPNSMTILEDMLPIAIDMTTKNITGIYNFTNPGTISHNEILELYKEYIDPNFQWVNFTLEEQSKILAAGRSNNELDVSKLLKKYPNIPNIKDSILVLFKRMKSYQ